MPTSLHPAVVETWPHFAALVGALEEMTSREHVIKTKEDKHRDFDDRELAERVARQLNRKGGPKIRSSAIV